MHTYVHLQDLKGIVYYIVSGKVNVSTIPNRSKEITKQKHQEKMTNYRTTEASQNVLIETKARLN